MKILSKKKCEEILKRITANEIIQAEYGLHDMEAETKATENSGNLMFFDTSAYVRSKGKEFDGFRININDLVK